MKLSQLFAHSWTRAATRETTPEERIKELQADIEYLKTRRDEQIGPNIYYTGYILLAAIFLMWTGVLLYRWTFL